MLIGVDFDNTVVRYDELFHRAAVELGLIPTELPLIKEEIRNYLRRTGKEDQWTELQGSVYGPYMEDAQPFDGAIEFFLTCKARGVDACIISHRTRHPFLGPAHDLHDAAHRWLDRHGFYDGGDVNLGRHRVHFALTKADKLKHIRLVGCTHFIDDLPEFLEESDFPFGVERFLFDPADHHESTAGYRRAGSWTEMEELLLTDQKMRAL